MKISFHICVGVWFVYVCTLHNNWDTRCNILFSPPFQKKKKNFFKYFQNEDQLPNLSCKQASDSWVFNQWGYSPYKVDFDPVGAPVWFIKGKFIK